MCVLQGRAWAGGREAEPNGRTDGRTRYRSALAGRLVTGLTSATRSKRHASSASTCTVPGSVASKILQVKWPPTFSVSAMVQTCRVVDVWTKGYWLSQMVALALRLKAQQSTQKKPNQRG